MTQFYAKIRTRGKACKYRKLLSTEETVYKSKSDLIASSCKYEMGADLDAEEWYSIPDFSSTNFSTDLIKSLNDNAKSNHRSTVEYELLSRKEYSQIDYLFIEVDGDFYFQKVGKTKLAERKSILQLGEEYRYVDNATVLTIQDYPDAIYDVKEDTLYFQRIESVSHIFKNISDLYREVTESEVEAFLKNDFIALRDGYCSGNVKIANRKRIAMAMDTLYKLNSEERNKIFLYIQDYCPDIIEEGNKFTIDSEEKLKMVLFGIEQRFYTTVVGQEKRVASTITTLKK